MALLFSAVTLTGDDNQVELLVPGIPKESNDLRGWTAYENFIASIDHEQEIRVHVAACLYGEGQPFLASPEEIAYFTLRAKEDDSFLCDHWQPCRSQRFPVHMVTGNVVWNGVVCYERMGTPAPAGRTIQV